MYNLHLSAEQLEIRDTVRDFVTREIKPVALKAERLDVADRRLLDARCSTRPRRWACARWLCRRIAAAPARIISPAAS